MNDIPQYKLSFAELIDKLTISQLRELLLNSTNYEKEISELEHDINLKLVYDGDIARDLRLVFLIAVLNALIWASKESMESKPEKYNEYLRDAHMWNGLKNQLKNILDERFEKNKTSKRTNIDTSGLDYHLSI
jgi:hypothetical protein